MTVNFRTVCAFSIIYLPIPDEKLVSMNLVEKCVRSSRLPSCRDLDFHEGADDKRPAEGKKRNGHYADIELISGN